jgi:UDPglucose 6-dehydrogenase
VGAEVHLVRKGIGSDARIGQSFLYAGVGYGGSCFPKDVKALIRTLREHGVDAGVLEAVEAVNAGQKRLLLEAVVARYGEDLSCRTFAVWGLSFKPETDDMREAPSLVVIEGLLERGATVQVHDPEAMEVARRYHLGDRVAYHEQSYDALAGADALLILTEWHLYRRPDLQRVRSLLRAPVLFDGRNLFDPARMQEAGFEYYSIGRPAVAPRLARAGVEG